MIRELDALFERDTDDTTNSSGAGASRFDRALAELGYSEMLVVGGPGAG